MDKAAIMKKYEQIVENYFNIKRDYDKKGKSDNAVALALEYWSGCIHGADEILKQLDPGFKEDAETIYLKHQMKYQGNKS